ncbi:MAG: hypothetical protein ACRCXO_20795 [Kluyvera intermedia]
MKYDVVALLSTILNDAGMGDILDSDLSNHSTITLKMKDDIPSIHVRYEDDEVWVWAKIVEQAPSSLSYCSASLFPLMLNHNEEYFYTGQPCLYPVDGNIELRAQVKERYLQTPEYFLSMLDNYLGILQEYRTILI